MPTAMETVILVAEWHMRLKPVVNSRSVLVLGLVVAAVTVVTVIAAKFFHRRERRRCRNDKSLFRELCMQQRVSGRDRRLLKRLAREQQLTPPSRIFVDPDFWDRLLKDMDYHDYLRRLTALHARLFAR